MRIGFILGLFAVALSFEITTPSQASGFITKAADLESGDADEQVMKGKACRQILSLLTGKYDDLDCENKPNDKKCERLKKAIDKKEEQCGDKEKTD